MRTDRNPDAVAPRQCTHMLAAMMAMPMRTGSVLIALAVPITMIGVIMSNLLVIDRANGSGVHFGLACGRVDRAAQQNRQGEHEAGQRGKDAGGGASTNHSLTPLLNSNLGVTSRLKLEHC